MGSRQTILLVVIGVILLIAAKMIYDGFNRKKKIMQRIKRSYGRLPKNDYSAGRYNDNGIAYYYKNREKTTPVIDDITWNDLDMETIYMILNSTESGVGEEYLYALLHTPCMDEEKLKERDRIATYFDEHEQERTKVQYELGKLGKLRNSSVGQYLTGIRSMRPHKPTLHMICLTALLLAIFGCIVNPAQWLPFIFFIIVINMVIYFKRKASISSYFAVFSYLSRMNQAALSIADLKCEGIAQYSKTLKDCAKPLSSISRYSWLFVSGTDFSADFLAIILDYIKMMTHFDMILFDYLAYRLFKYGKELDQIMEIIGEIDCDIAIASYRRYMADGQKTPVCRPVLHSQEKVFIKAVNIYHPMIVNPVMNSISEDRSVLLTGSNASGKSTFLKTIAINAILAQTICTCLADSYEAPFFRVYSSMALKDDIQSNESYYIVEIKSLKRIIDAASQKEDAYAHIPVLCFIDEVLRGTNTIERIAASSRILEAISRMNVLCFAATHDIELTAILEKDFSDYHFQEEVTDDDVAFDYVLYPGRATSRNAIKLLGIIGFNKDIIQQATQAARDFEETGTWAALTN